MDNDKRPTNDVAKRGIPLRELERLFGLIRAEDRNAFHLFDSLFRRRIRRRIFWSGVSKGEFDDLYHEIALGFWFSASRVTSAEKLTSHIDHVTRKAIRYYVRTRLKKRDCADKIAELEVTIHILTGESDLKLVAGAKAKAIRLLAELRRLLQCDC